MFDNLSGGMNGSELNGSVTSGKLENITDTRIPGI